MQMTEKCWIELFVFDSNTWNHLTVCKQMKSGSFKIYLQTIHLQIILRGFGIK